MTDIFALGSDILPVATLRNLEPMILGELGKFYVTTGLLHGNGILFVIHVRNSFEKKKREDVGLEVSSVYRATQDIGRLPEMSGEGSDVPTN
jgi:hypothetical protein